MTENTDNARAPAADPAAMRKALVQACDIISCYQMSEADGEFPNQDREVAEWFATADSILSAPPETPSNAAAMREALVKIREYIITGNTGYEPKELLELILNWCDSSLTEPPRNCDVGTADEQADRFKAFCYANRTPGNECSKECRFNDTSAVCYCQARWAQTPYMEGDADGK